jgi:predicted nucleotidyltransferase
MTLRDKKKIYEEAKELLKTLLKKRLKKIVLYGSFARNTETSESDIDIMVLTDLDDNEIKTLNDAINKITLELSLKYDIVFSFMVINNDHFTKYLNIVPFYKNVSDEGIVLYGR